MLNILICDDEVDIVNALEIYLGVGEYVVFKAYNGAQAIEVIQKEDIHLAIMDIMMPVMNGIDAMNKIREISNIPIILLTAKSEDSDKIMGLNAGADDYITKPFNPVEVLARVKSQLRRYMRLGSAIVTQNIIKVGGIVIDDDSKSVTIDDEPIKLTPTEYDILKLLSQNPDKVFSPEDIYRTIWSDNPIGAQNTVAVHIRHMREKIEFNPSEPRYIKVVWGQGYKLQSQKS